MSFPEGLTEAGVAAGVKVFGGQIADGTVMISLTSLTDMIRHTIAISADSMLEILKKEIEEAHAAEKDT